MLEYKLMFYTLKPHYNKYNKIPKFITKIMDEITWTTEQTYRNILVIFWASNEGNKWLKIPDGKKEGSNAP